jgi:hypothetical protein
MAGKIIAQEYPQGNEIKLIQEMKHVIMQSLAKDYGRQFYLRRFHAKSTGLVRGLFIINPNLPASVQKGVFTPRPPLNCYVRFSNGSTKNESDHEPGIRGMAIKLLNAGSNAEIPDDCGDTQDFLLTNSPILFPGTLETQHAAILTLFKKWNNFLSLLLPLRLWGLSTFLRSQVSPASSLNLSYYSGTPYLYGEGKAVKWIVSPLQLSELNKKPSTDFLRENLHEDLLRADFYFNFGIQLQEDPVLQPIEDSSIRWRTPVINLATLVLIKQDINDPVMTAKDQQIHFNPWHCLSDHRPLGGPNRFRKEYTSLMHFRKAHGHCSKASP